MNSVELNEGLVEDFLVSEISTLSETQIHFLSEGLMIVTFFMELEVGSD